MKLYTCAILAVISVQTFAFNIGKEQSALSKKIPSNDLAVPILTETATGFVVKIGEREPRILGSHEEDCDMFSYPSDGGNYGNNDDVVILVDPQTPGSRDIVFTRFNTEHSYDFVSIFVWQNNEFVLETRISGIAGQLDKIVAPEGRFLVAFTSDNTGSSTGFTVAYFKTIPVQEKDTSVVAHKFALEDAQAPVLKETAEGLQVQLGDRLVQVVQLSGDCGSFGSFAYPSNGGSYSNNEDIAFLIVPEAGEALEIAFTKLDVESNYDYVSVHVWENNQFRLVGRYSGGLRPSTDRGPSRPYFDFIHIRLQWNQDRISGPLVRLKLIARQQFGSGHVTINPQQPKKFIQQG